MLLSPAAPGHRGFRSTPGQQLRPGPLFRVLQPALGEGLAETKAGAPRVQGRGPGKGGDTQVPIAGTVQGGGERARCSHVRDPGSGTHPQLPRQDKVCSASSSSASQTRSGGGVGGDELMLLPMLQPPPARTPPPPAKSLPGLASPPGRGSKTTLNCSCLGWISRLWRKGGGGGVWNPHSKFHSRLFPKSSASSPPKQPQPKI